MCGSRFAHDSIGIPELQQRQYLVPNQAQYPVTLFYALLVLFMTTEDVRCKLTMLKSCCAS